MQCSVATEVPCLNELKHERKLLTNSVWKISELAFPLSKCSLLPSVTPVKKALFLQTINLNNSSEEFHIPSAGNFTIGNMASSSVMITFFLFGCFGDLKQLSLSMAAQGFSPVLIDSSEGGFR